MYHPIVGLIVWVKTELKIPHTRQICRLTINRDLRSTQPRTYLGSFIGGTYWRPSVFCIARLCYPELIVLLLTSVRAGTSPTMSSVFALTSDTLLINYYAFAASKL